mgnify:CR=1 FL=1
MGGSPWVRLMGLSCSTSQAAQTQLGALEDQLERTREAAEDAKERATRCEGEKQALELEVQKVGYCGLPRPCVMAYCTRL